MNDLVYSKHSVVRMSQRALSNTVFSLLLEYGETRRCRGNAESVYFSRDSLRQIMNDHGHDYFKKCEKVRNAYAIVSEDGVLITVARSYRKAIH